MPREVHQHLCFSILRGFEAQRADHNLPICAEITIQFQINAPEMKIYEGL
jgi:hypothetical protein